MHLGVLKQAAGERFTRRNTPAGRPEYMKIFNFERFKLGGVRRDHIEYAAFDLEQFARAPRLTPSTADIELGRRLIGRLRRRPPAMTAARASAQLTMIKGNKAERDILLAILGFCGILGTASHP